jgi:alkylation response protein AidB-like acyl-CoA dehydrogenase
LTEPVAAPVSRPADLLAAATSLADEFATRADKIDLDGVFPFENFDRLAQEGFLGLTAPEEFGGFGAGLIPMLEVLEKLAMGCGSTALAASLHLQTVLYMSDELKATGDPRIEAILRGCGRNEVVICGAMSEPQTGGRITNAATKATRVDGGFVIDGMKIFATNSPAMTHFRSSASWDSPDGVRVVNFVVNQGIEGLQPLGDWDTMGMRGSGSQSIRFKEMFVPDDQIWFIREPGVWDKFLMKLFFIVWVGIPVVYLGIAQAMRDFAVQWALKRVRYPAPRPVSHEPGVQSAVARMDAHLATARTLLYSTAQKGVDRGDSLEALTESFHEVTRSKYTINQSVVQVAQEALYLVGGSAYFRKHPLQRMYRDAISAPFHALNLADSEEAIGKWALGIPLDAEPRWG